MQRELCRVGMSVQFGRTRGEKTIGVVEKLNPKKAKVRTTEQRGETPAGTVWNVPYSLLSPTDASVDRFPVGQRIAGVRLLTSEECEHAGWEPGPFDCAVAIVLSDGSILYASQDYEGNGPGALFGRLRTGEAFTVSPSEVPA